MPIEIYRSHGTDKFQPALDFNKKILPATSYSPLKNQKRQREHMRQGKTIG